MTTASIMSSSNIQHEHAPSEQCTRLTIIIHYHAIQIKITNILKPQKVTTFFHCFIQFDSEHFIYFISFAFRFSTICVHLRDLQWTCYRKCPFNTPVQINQILFKWPLSKSNWKLKITWINGYVYINEKLRHHDVYFKATLYTGAMIRRLTWYDVSCNWQSYRWTFCNSIRKRKRDYSMLNFDICENYALHVHL